MFHLPLWHRVSTFTLHNDCTEHDVCTLWVRHRWSKLNWVWKLNDCFLMMCWLRYKSFRCLICETLYVCVCVCMTQKCLLVLYAFDFQVDLNTLESVSFITHLNALNKTYYYYYERVWSVRTVSPSHSILSVRKDNTRGSKYLQHTIRLLCIITITSNLYAKTVDFYFYNICSSTRYNLQFHCVF